MKIIELFGVPGAGKTMATVYLYRKFEKLGYKCCLLRENEYEDLVSLNRRKYILKIFKCRNWLLIIKLLFLSVFYKGKKYYLGNTKNKLKILFRQLMYLEIYKDKNLEKEYDVLISDQGLVQEITGFLLESKQGIPILVKFLDIVKSSSCDMHYVYVNKPIDVVKENIHKRNRKLSEMDFFDGKTLNRYLTDYDKKLTQTYDNFNKKYNFIKFDDYIKRECLDD